MKKYEYKKVPSGQIDVFFDLESLGQDGWELCGIANLCWIFKREIQSQNIHVGLLESCAYARGVGNLQHRTIAEFAQFVEDVMSDKPEYQKYRFDWNSRHAIETWIEKFYKYSTELYDGIMRQMINDDISNRE